ncbi:ATP-binding protein [Streptomyces sp. NPDC004609]|uniref:ATP-binding protein n=1 Tax=Streptomyces sp. NPDC004609 TaxID=3364704 RepID=UPI0036C3F32E
MDVCRCEVSRKAFELPFLAEARELVALRRITRLHLNHWGLPGLIDAAQLCVSELVGNVIRHIGDETPTTLRLAMNNTRLRIEVQDPDPRVLPTVLSARAEDESGRGLALVEGMAACWGVILRDDSKVTWCELETSLTSPRGHVSKPGIARAEALLILYGAIRRPEAAQERGLDPAVVEESAIDVLADVLQWLRAHGRDAEAAMDRAHMHCENELR